MTDQPTPTNEFLVQVTALIEQNLSNEQFGVSELAEALNMSRSNLLRKVKKDTRLSVSQLINQVRLQRAMQMLRKSSLNVSEVSHQVGFNSPSYFIKCFREYYGYPPGEVGKRPETEPVAEAPGAQNRWPWIAGVVVLIVAAISLYVIYSGQSKAQPEKSIAVLPFKNESNDSTNVYLINGLMESTLSNLQKIKDLRVISRTSTETYRNHLKSIPEMGKELNVSYFVEGSGQKIGNEILLHVQLIEASSDRHLWSAQYKRETKDIFELQQEIARSIAEEIQAVITPEEKKRIEKKPTENLAAYDLFLKGSDLLLIRNNISLEKSIEFFKQAVEEDAKFALAYAATTAACFYLDAFQTSKKYSEEISHNADMAILYDPKLGESLVAKAMDYMSKKEYEAAIPYLEKALEYNPNSATVIGFLTDFYAIYVPNTGKYIEYALKGVQLGITSMDSATASFTYLRLGNALIQNGFVDESLKYIDRSIAYNPNNPYSNYVRAFVLFAKDKNAAQARDRLLVEFNKDSSRFDILQDIGKLSYHMRDYAAAYKYYKKFLATREAYKLDIYPFEDLTIGFVLAQVGEKAKSEALVERFKAFVESDHSVYKQLGLSAYYTYRGDRVKAREHMDLFAKEENVQYWIFLFLESDPIMSGAVKDDPAFKKSFEEAKDRFWNDHEKLKVTLQGKGLL